MFIVMTFDSICCHFRMSLSESEGKIKTPTLSAVKSFGNNNIKSVVLKLNSLSYNLYVLVLNKNYKK